MDEVVIVDYNPHWPLIFAQEAALIFKVLDILQTACSLPFSLSHWDAMIIAACGMKVSFLFFDLTETIVNLKEAGDRF